MKGILLEFNSFGPSVIDVAKVCAKWDNRFSISYWNDVPTLEIKAKGKNYLKTVISVEQSEEIIKKLELIKVQSPVFKSGCSFHAKKDIEADIERLTKSIDVKLEAIDLERESRRILRNVLEDNH